MQASCDSYFNSKLIHANLRNFMANFLFKFRAFVLLLFRLISFFIIKLHSLCTPERLELLLGNWLKLLAAHDFSTIVARSSATTFDCIRDDYCVE